MTGRPLGRWRLERRAVPTGALLEPWPPVGEDGERAVRAGHVLGRAALVIGSTQDRSVVDLAAAAAAGVDVVRRSTGGGAVLVAPGAQVWLDLWVPRHDELWDDDIVGAALWIGRTWVEALRRLGAPPLEVHRGRATTGGWSDVVCFAGLGPGEVRMGGTGGGAKVVGIAQRRTRRGARFHVAALLAWEPGPLLALLRVEDRSDALSTLGGLDDVAVGLRAVTAAPYRHLADGELVTAVENAVIGALP